MLHEICDDFEYPKFNDVARAIAYDPEDVVIIKINSGGGDAVACLGVMAAVNEAKAKGKKVVAFVSGIAMSAGAEVMWMCDEIYLSPCSLVMFHKAHNLYEGSLLGVLALKAYDTCRRIFSRRDTFLEAVNKVDIAPWEVILKARGHKKVDGDYYFTAQEFVKLFPGKTKIGVPLEVLKSKQVMTEDGEVLVVCNPGAFEDDRDDGDCESTESEEEKG
jgi:ATP-dependent protease ClpP protease subunit